jgi:septum formation protein
LASINPAQVSGVRLVLASASPARRRVLTEAGITPIVQVSQVDEDALTAELQPIGPAELALALARAKAQDVAAHFAGRDDTLVVGCDSVFDLDGIAYGKPLTSVVAIDRIRSMSGRTGHLHTGHWAIRGNRSTGTTTTTGLTFAELSEEEITGYVATGEPLNVAGAFTLDGHSAPFIRRIVGDPSNVIGISMPTMRDLARDLGLSWPDLWTST